MCNVHFCMQVEIYLNNECRTLQFGGMRCVTLQMFGGASPTFWPLFAACAGEQGQRHGAPLSQLLKRAFGIPATDINTVQVTDWVVAFTGPFQRQN